jgi:putative transposase
LHPERPTMTYLIEHVRARCSRAELSPPDRRTIKARVDRIDRRVAALKRKDSKGVKATTAVPGQYFASRPLEVVQIDHTEVDLFLVDESTREAMSVRPWLTLAIDVFTRMVVGFHLSMAKPSRVSIRQILPRGEIRTSTGQAPKPSLMRISQGHILTIDG